ncbi:MAG: VCBS repeat-containing protein [Saprospiraceae bacterium]|nr:VCBS repeat-containing protein [Saprospiraceae bacterium]
MWYETDTVPQKEWRKVQIGEGIHGGIGPRGFGDLDNDGDMDIVRGNHWYENLDGKGGSWETHADLIPTGGNRPDKYGLALKSWVVDLDNDGDLDIIEAEADTRDGRIFWFENIANAHQWKFHAISANETGQDFHSLAVADFDSDGDLDIFSGGGPLSTNEIEMYIWENKSPDGTLWVAHTLMSGKMCHEAVAADVDGDGDIDICTKPWNGDDLHLFLENKLIARKP